MRAYAADPQTDFRELFLRLIFTILVSNKDDHLKNHGFLYVGAGRWRLSPVFDVNPAPDRNPHLETAMLEGGAHDRSINWHWKHASFSRLPKQMLVRSSAKQRCAFLANGEMLFDRWASPAPWRANTRQPS